MTAKCFVKGEQNSLRGLKYFLGFPPVDQPLVGNLRVISEWKEDYWKVGEGDISEISSESS